MHFGMFMEFGPRDGGSDAGAFREGFELVDRAEAWGLDSVWLSEFHFTPDRSVLASPIVVAGAIAGRTTRLRIGMAVYVLPLNNPLRIAEEVATVDHISGGRFDFGVGRSGFVNSYRTYGVPYEESQARFDEAIEILRRAWEGKPFSFHGRFYTVERARVVPQPVQRPHPPMRMAASSPATFEKVAALGLPIFVGLRGDDLSALAESLTRYRQVWRRAGHPGNGSVYLRVPLYVAETEQAALEEPRECITHYFRRQARLVAAVGADKGPGAGNKGQTARKLAELSYDDILQKRVAFGAPDALVQRLQDWHDTLGIDGIVAEMNAGGLLSEGQVLKSLELLTHEVMPAFRTTA